MKTTVVKGDRIRPCITVRSLSYRYAYVHPCDFIVTKISSRGVTCRILKDGIIGRTNFLYKSWVRSAFPGRVLIGSGT